MDLKTSNELFLELEMRFDVWSWQFQGMAYWPLLRMYLWRLLIAKISREVTPVNNVPPKTAKLSIPTVVPEAKYSREQLKKRVSKSFISSEQTDFLLLARHEDCIEKLDTQLHDRIVDPIFRLLKNQGHSVVKVISSRSKNSNSDRFSEPAHIFSADSFGGISCPAPDITHLADLFEFINDKAQLNIIPNDPGFRSLLVRTYQRAIVTDAVLDVYKPKVVMLGVFYDAFQMASVYACKLRGIKVVDIQHGKQGRYHAAYTDWSQLPYEGSKFLPNYFWVWGQKTAKRIDQSFKKKKLPHCTIVGGNQWLAEWKENLHAASNSEREFFESQSHYKKRILISLQPISNPIGETLLKALKAAPKDWVFWFRAHNKQKVHIEKLTNELSQVNVNFEITLPSALPLYSLLKVADHHITAWSTVAFEAETFACKTSLVHDLSRTILAEEIAERRFFYARNSEALVAQIQTGRQKWFEAFKYPITLFWKKPAPYILADSKIASQALAHICSDNS